MEDDGGAAACAAEADLWERAAAGDEAAFAAVFRRHARAVYNHAFRRTASWAQAEDLTSAVFLEAWRRRRDVALSEQGSVLPWLLGVATNLSRNANRSLRRYRGMLERLPAVEAAGVDPAEVVAAKVDAERQMRRVLAAVQQLSDAEKDLIGLCVWSGLSYAEAAVALGVPVGTVRSRLARARTRLHVLSAEPKAAGTSEVKGAQE